jgi:hypothetical protein
MEEFKNKLEKIKKLREEIKSKRNFDSLIEHYYLQLSEDPLLDCSDVAGVEAPKSISNLSRISIS